METKSNVISLKGRLKQNSSDKPAKKTGAKASVTDIGKIREEIINDERRRVKRTILTEFIGANVVIPGKGLMKVALYDISEDGIAFDMDVESGKFSPDEEVAMRVYMNHQTYFPFYIRVSHAVLEEEEGVYRHGARFVKNTLNKDALFHFVKFIENISANLRSDSGDVMVSNIK